MRNWKISFATYGFVLLSSYPLMRNWKTRRLLTLALLTITATLVSFNEELKVSNSSKTKTTLCLLYPLMRNWKFLTTQWAFGKRSHRVVRYPLMRNWKFLTTHGFELLSDLVSFNEELKGKKGLDNASIRLTVSFNEELKVGKGRGEKWYRPEQYPLMRNWKLCFYFLFFLFLFFWYPLMRNWKTGSSIDGQFWPICIL